jgi:Mrp family chromosome partitioning ATPase
MTSQGIPGIRNVVAIGAGKGGVGKSTTTVNLAIALAQKGARVGVIDADVYGPNLPQMLGINIEPGHIELTADQKMIPPEAHGITARCSSLSARWIGANSTTCSWTCLPAPATWPSPSPRALELWARWW